MPRPRELASWRAFERADREWFRIHGDEVQALNFGGELFNDWREAGQTNPGLRLRRELREVVDLEKAPPPTEVGHLVELLEDGYREQVCI